MPVSDLINVKPDRLIALDPNTSPSTFEVTRSALRLQLREILAYVLLEMRRDRALVERLAG